MSGPCFLVTLRRFVTSDGGRQRPIFGSYHPNWNLGNTWRNQPSLNDGRVFLEDRDELAPNMEGPARIEPLCAEAWARSSGSARVRGTDVVQAPRMMTAGTLFQHRTADGSVRVTNAPHGPAASSRSHRRRRQRHRARDRGVSQCARLPDDGREQRAGRRRSVSRDAPGSRARRRRASEEKRLPGVPRDQEHRADLPRRLPPRPHYWAAHRSTTAHPGSTAHRRPPPTTTYWPSR